MRCKHEKATGWFWVPERPDPWTECMCNASTDPRIHDRVICDDCGAWLSLSPSNDEPEAVRVEMRAAELAAALDNGLIISTNSDECVGWRMGDNRMLEANFGYRAGYLARAICEHKDGDQ